MSLYLLSVHTTESDVLEGDIREEARTPEEMQKFIEDIYALESEMKASGTFVFSGRLSDPDAATVVRVSDGDVVMTDGPFVESKEHIGGFYIINANDLDEALAWAGKVVKCINEPIEVRPFFETRDA